MARSTSILAILLVVGLAVWLASGMLGEEGAPSPTARSPRTELPLVEVVRSRAESVRRNIVVQGDVRAFRSASARAERDGQVTKVLANLGDRVERTEALARLTLEGLGSRLREAQAVLEQRRADYEAAATLLERGAATPARVRDLRTQLGSAREAVRQLESDIENTVIRAPFDAVVDGLEVEEGEFVSANSEIATLVDNSPLRIVVRINQADIARVPEGGAARVEFATGDTAPGRICFIAASAEPATRTFRVEVRTTNAKNRVPSGISAEVDIPTGSVGAHFVSPAILSLGTDGTLGVKTVSGNGEVSFYPVDVVRAQTDGVWVAGLPESARVITTGQGFVQAGDRVKTAEAASEVGVREELTRPPASEEQALQPPPEAICERRPVVDGEAAAEEAAASARAGREMRVARSDAPFGATDELPGSDSETVADLQQGLARLGYQPGPVDGVLGEQTREALRSYQAANGLEVTGEPNRATIGRILEDSALGREAGARQ